MEWIILQVCNSSLRHFPRAHGDRDNVWKKEKSTNLESLYATLVLDTQKAGS